MNLRIYLTHNLDSDVQSLLMPWHFKDRVRSHSLPLLLFLDASPACAKPIIATVAASFFYLYYIFVTDIDECTAKSDNCDPKANCSNTHGSFTCSCSDGYYGDGASCNGL